MAFSRKLKAAFSRKLGVLGGGGSGSGSQHHNPAGGSTSTPAFSSHGSAGSSPASSVGGGGHGKTSGSSSASSSSLASPVDDTTDRKYDALKADFTRFNHHIRDLRDRILAVLDATDAMCATMDGLSEGMVPVLSIHDGLRNDAGGYLNAVTSVTQSLGTRFRKAVGVSVLTPLDAILRAHAELLMRDGERDEAARTYRRAKKELRGLQKRGVGRRGNGQGGMGDKERTRRANTVNKLSTSHTLYTTLTECLADEYTAVLSVREQVVAELFARLRSCQGYFLLGAGAAFTEAQVEESFTSSLASPLYGRPGSREPLSPAHQPLPLRPDVEGCLAALSEIQETPAVRWEALGRPSSMSSSSSKSRKVFLHREVPLMDDFEAPSRGSTSLRRRSRAHLPSMDDVGLDGSGGGAGAGAGARLHDDADDADTPDDAHRIHDDAGAAYLGDDRCPTPSEMTPPTTPPLTGTTTSGHPPSISVGTSASEEDGGEGVTTSSTAGAGAGAGAGTAVRPDDVAVALKASPASVTVLRRRKAWLRRVVQGLTVTDLMRMSAVCKLWHQRVQSDPQLWGQVVGGRGVPNPVRRSFWLWISGASECPLPAWRLKLLVSSTPITRCTPDMYDMWRSAAESEASTEPAWAAVIDQDVQRTYVDSLPFGACRALSRRRSSIPTAVLTSASSASSSSGTPRSMSMSEVPMLRTASDSSSGGGDGEWELIESQLDVPVSASEVEDMVKMSFTMFVSNEASPAPSPTAPGTPAPTPPDPPALSVSSSQHSASMSTTPSAMTPTSLARRRQRLSDLLRVIAIKETSVRYTQGMNFMGAMVLESVPEEFEAFNVLRALFRRYGFDKLYNPDLQSLGLRFYQFERLLVRFLPRLGNHLTVEGVSPAMYSSVWFLTLFSSFNALDLATTRVLWDRFLCAGWQEVFRFALGLMQVLEPLLLDKPLEDLMPILQAPRLHYHATTASFVTIADKFDVTERQLKILETQFRSSAASAGDEAPVSVSTPSSATATSSPLARARAASSGSALGRSSGGGRRR